MVGVSASVNLPLHLKVPKFSSGTSSPGWSQKKGHKTVVVWWCWVQHKYGYISDERSGVESYPYSVKEQGRLYIKCSAATQKGKGIKRLI